VELRESRDDRVVLEESYSSNSGEDIGKVMLEALDFGREL